MGIDTIQINFSEGSLLIMNIVIGFIMFGVALDLKLADFKQAIKSPKSFLIGMGCQFLVLPAFTFLMVLIIQPHPSIALGLFLVAACPSGNLSNFLTHLAKGNTALSISMSAVSTVAAIIMTPLNTIFWASRYEPTREILKEFSISAGDMLSTIFLMLGLPLVIGMVIRAKFPIFAQKVSGFMMKLSIVVFIAFVGVMLANNFEVFLKYVGVVAIIVMIQNALALLSGYGAATLLKVPIRDRRAISIETGIQNSGLGLVLIFNFFGGLGGMALVAAFWGIWHIVSGLTVALFWSRKAPAEEESVPIQEASI